MTQWFQFSTLQQPLLLLLWIPVALLLVVELLSRPGGMLRVSTGDTLRKLARTRSNAIQHVPAALRAAGLAFMVFALARPVDNIRANVEEADIIDIMLAVDVSGSMTQEDFIVSRQRRDRLFVTKLAVYDFIDSRRRETSGLLGTDRVGLLLYAKYAWMQCPLTLDYSILRRELERVEIDKNDEKHSRTAIGSAIGLAVSKLNKSEADSKVIILLTDGLNNEGSLDPVTAAQLARDYDIKIYTIGAGATESSSSNMNALLGVIGGRNNPIDEEALKRIAEITGGRYYRASDAESLQRAYQEIDELERTKIEVGETFSFDEVFPPYALVGAMFLALSVFSRRAWFEAIP